jgi:hypothetical protein
MNNEKVAMESDICVGSHQNLFSEWFIEKWVA